MKFFIFWLFITVEKSLAHECFLLPQHLSCMKHLPQAEFPSDIKTLELHKLEIESIDVNEILKKFPIVENISIFGGNLSKFLLPSAIFAKNNQIKVLQLKQVGVENIGNSFLGKFPKLQTLNLQGNYLQSLKKNFSFAGLKNIYLSGNMWNCSSDLDWVQNLNRSIVKDLDELICFGEPHSGKSLLTIAKFMKETKNQCPEICNCTLPKVVRNPESDQLEPIIEVNCSSRNLLDFPSNLPEKTKILHLEENEIINLKSLRNNPTYRNILDIYLDNNRINSIDELEGSYWLRHFRVFSISGNKLSELPTYALDNALQQNINMPNAVRITLGGNPWRCDCIFTPVFQEMLQKFAPQIKDIDEVKCSYVEGDENSLLPIIELSRSSVCRLPTEYSVQALDLLNGILASLIILILGKLAYDYYHFKRSGKLPWIVTKMP